MKQLAWVFPIILLLLSCSRKEAENKEANINSPFIVVLGTLQDGGSPHAGCGKKCCQSLYKNPEPSHKTISLGLVDPSSNKAWLFEASPDLPTQLYELNTAAGRHVKNPPEGIFLTHAHIGHYSGLMYLGREVMNTKRVPVYAMPRFKKFLETNGPWAQLVSIENIIVTQLENERPVVLSPSVSVKPFLVPHRDEYSETVGFVITGSSKKVLFIPDIDKWSKWDKQIQQEISKVDIAFIDGTFYDGEEINNRNISEIPHPFVSESMEQFKNMPADEKQKVHFIHFNHTNPLLVPISSQAKTLDDAGFRLAFKGQKIYL